MSPVEDGSCLASAPANFALAKYWGKSDARLRHPLVPSVSACVEGLYATARVTFSPGVQRDRVLLAGAPADGDTRARVLAVLDAVRRRAGVGAAADVDSRTGFPVAAGLASSAAGLAAVAGAAWGAAGLDRADQDGIAEVARLGSGSAARSVHGGYVVWEPHEGGSRIRHLAPAEHWPLELCLVEVSSARKPVGSTEAMAGCAATSPVWPAWVGTAPADALAIEAAVRARDFQALAEHAEANCLLMHATTTAARPPVFFFLPETWRLLSVVRELRAEGTPCFFTVDAGPNVKVFCEPGRGSAVAEELRSRTAGAYPVRESRVGSGLRYGKAEAAS